MSEQDVPDEYDEWTVAEVADAATDVEDPEVLQSWLVYEQDHDDRVTAVNALEERLDAISVDTETADEDDDTTPAIEDIPEGTTRIRVRNPQTTGQHVAGYSFRGGEAKLIPDRPDVRDALRSGDLQYVGPR